MGSRKLHVLVIGKSLHGSLKGSNSIKLALILESPELYRHDGWADGQKATGDVVATVGMAGAVTMGGATLAGDAVEL